MGWCEEERGWKEFTGRVIYDGDISPLSIAQAALGTVPSRREGQGSFPKSPYFFLDLGQLYLGKHLFPKVQIKDLETSCRGSSQLEGGPRLPVPGRGSSSVTHDVLFCSG